MTTGGPASLRKLGSPLGYLLRLVRVDASHRAAEEGCLLSEALRDFSILAVLAEHGPASQQWLAEYLKINRSVMVKLIDALEAGGQVLRTRNRADRRSYALAGTPSGRARAKSLRRQLDSIAAACLARLSASQQRRLGELLGRLVAPEFEPPLPELLASCNLFLVSRAHEAMVACGDEELTPCGIDVRHFVSLALLADQSCSQIALASHLLIGAASTVDLVDSLESIGAVERRRNPADRRSYLLEVTGEGHRLAEEARARLAAATEAFTRPLDSAENEELLGLLAVVAELAS